MGDLQRLGLSRRRSLQLATAAAALPFAPAAKAANMREDPVAQGRDQSFDRDWRFHRGDGPDWGEKAFNDSAWRRLDLPHDWSIEDLEAGAPAVNAVITTADTAPIWQPVKDAPKRIGPFDGGSNLLLAASESAGGAATGHTVGGVGWYRKRFRLPQEAAGSRVELVFDGVYANADVWINGQHLGSHPNGYTPFAFDLTPHLDLAGDNLVAVRVTNLGRNSRWYSGSGIYRHVRLNVTNALHFTLWGVSVTTPTVSERSATVQVRARVEGLLPGAVVVTKICDAAGRVAAEARGPASANGVIALDLPRPKLWSPETPVLYQMECELFDGEKRADRIITPFGVRRVEIDAQNGLRINGKPYKLRGGCVHHDNGHLGAAAFDRAEERKIELLKARGFNALRTSHNVPSPAFLDACDRHGVLVLEEPFDCWNAGKNPDDYHLYFKGHWRDDLAAMVGRDGNHPSVIIWSIGNEIPDTLTPEGIKTARALTEELRRLDPTRPITQGINGPNGPDVTTPSGKPEQTASQFLDIAGYNYKLNQYEKMHAGFPNRVMVGTESWPAELAEVWRLVDRSPYLIGDFVWTAMDHLGESGIGRSMLPGAPFPGAADYPWFNAFCGDLDLIGEQKPQSLVRDVVWGLSPLEVCVQRPTPNDVKERITQWGWRDELPSWTWPGAEGKALNVRVYTRGDRVEVTLNGRKVAEQAVTEADKATALVPVPYAPGKLVATAFLAGKPIGRRELETVGELASIRLRADRPQIRADRNDLAYFTVEILDARGRLVPDAVQVVEVGLSGPAELAAFGNANPRGVASFRQPVAKTWHGRALVIARATGEPGSITVEARAKGLKTAVARIRVDQD